MLCYSLLLYFTTCQAAHWVSLSASSKKVATTHLGDVHNLYYTVPVQIGNQKFNLLLDTGSGTTWVISTRCRKRACFYHNKYDNKNSPTYQGTYTHPFYLLYADNSQEIGYYSVDKVTVAGLTVKSQYFGEVVNIRNGDDTDGIFGLGPDSQVATALFLKPLTFVTNLQKDGVITKRVFSIRLTGGDDSILTIGDLDNSLYSGKLTYASVLPRFNSWTISVDSLNIGDTQVCQNTPAIIDSGTSTILVPTYYMDYLQTIQSIRVYDNNLYVLCSLINELPQLSIVISGVKFSLDATDYVIFNYWDLYCPLLISIRNLDEWILGEPFLRKYYAVFDADNNRVALALSAYRSHHSHII